MEWRQLLRDKRMWYAGGIAAAIGVGVLWSRKRATGTTATPGTVAPAGYQGVGTLDTTGTDVAHWLGDYSASLQNELDQSNAALQGKLDAWTKTLQDSLAGKGTGGDTPPATGSTRSVDVAGGTWLKTVLDQYGISQAQLFGLNPDIGNDLAWASDKGYDESGGTQVFSRNSTTITVPA